MTTADALAHEIEAVAGDVARAVRAGNYLRAADYLHGLLSRVLRLSRQPFVGVIAARSR